MRLVAPAGDPLGSLAWALDLVREAFALVFAVAPEVSEANETERAIQTWHLESAVRRLVRVTGTLRAMASASDDSRIVEVASRFELERQAATVRLAQLLGEQPGGRVAAVIVDDATGPIPVLDDAHAGSRR